MKETMKLFRLFLMLALPLTFYSCDKCVEEEENCLPNATFQFRLEDAAGNNLLHNRQVNPDSVRVQALQNGSAQQEVQISRYNQDTDAFSMSFPTSPNYNRYLLRYNATSADTLSFSYTFNESECCGRTVRQYSAQRNNQTLCSNCDNTIVRIVK